MEYEDFDLYIEHVAGEEYRVSVLDSPGGEATTLMRFPYGELALKNRLLALENALLRASGRRRWAPAREEREVLDFGQALFEAMLTGEVRSRYEVSWDRVRLEGKGLRIKLRFQNPTLAALPWEFLYNKNLGEFLALSKHTPVVRYLELPQALGALSVTPPLRILAMVANPTDLPKLDVAVEKERVERAIAGLKKDGLIELEWLKGQTWRALQRAMRRGPWHIFHFIGHGGFDDRRDEGFLVFADREDKSQPIGATNVARLISDHTSLRVVILNSCAGGHGGRDVFSSTASILVRRGTPCVLAMQYEITDRAAIEFVHTFYEALVDGLPIESAVTEARVAISVGIANSLEWGTPVLFSHAPDGVLFSLADQPKPRIVTPAPIAEEVKRLLKAGESARGKADWPALRKISQDILTRDGSQRQARQWLAEADERLTMMWQLTSTGLPLIEAWSQLRGVDPLPQRIVWQPDGKEMVLVPAGQFLMGTTEEEALRLAKEWGYNEKLTLAETPQREITLPAFYLDVTPVTHAEYVRFLAAYPNLDPPFVDEVWARPYNWNREMRRPPSGLEQHPVVLVSWEDASAYAAWAGKQLPKEEQWEKAARGIDGRRYPWGNRWDLTRLNSAERLAGRPLRNFVLWRSWWDALDRSKQAYTTPVGDYPAGVSPHGLLGMAGNVWEWTDSWYQAYPGSQSKNDDFGETYRVVRGGAWGSYAYDVRSSIRGIFVPDVRGDVVGFRCASTAF